MTDLRPTEYKSALRRPEDFRKMLERKIINKLAKLLLYPLSRWGVLLPSGERGRDKIQLNPTISARGASPPGLPNCYQNAD